MGLALLLVALATLASLAIVGFALTVSALNSTHWE